MEKPSAIKVIRARPELYVDDSFPLAESIISMILAGMVHEKICEFEVQISGSLISIFADRDWIRPAFPNYALDRFVPVAGRANTFRAEVLLSALKARYCYLCGEEPLFASGSDFAELAAHSSSRKHDKPFVLIVSAVSTDG